MAAVGADDGVTAVADCPPPRAAKAVKAAAATAALVNCDSCRDGPFAVFCHVTGRGGGRGGGGTHLLSISRQKLSPALNANPGLAPEPSSEPNEPTADPLG
mmetsp:Transcript_30764/g.69143  ORF Transcript_30764/g.69143 Transcript_30764/m.69143 type:complete len:101 (-) Transcript_30764:835-1137(-)